MAFFVHSIRSSAWCVASPKTIERDENKTCELIAIKRYLKGKLNEDQTVGSRHQFLVFIIKLFLLVDIDSF